METIEGFVNFVHFVNFWTKEQAQSQGCKHEERTKNVINGHYMLASPSIKQMVSNKCHKRERQVNQSHASGSDNFNGAEEVYIYIYSHTDTSVQQRSVKNIRCDSEFHNVSIALRYTHWALYCQ